MRIGVRAALKNDGLVRVLARNHDHALDRQVAAVLELARIAGGKPLESLPPAAARRAAEQGFSALDFDTAPMAEVTDTCAGSVPIRIFVPRNAGRDWIVYFHGGGGVIGSITASEPATRYLAERSKCTVASVGYRLGPEHRHPAAIEDAVAAWDAISERAKGRIAVAGDSFGGLLSAHVDRHARRFARRRPDAQVLIYPMIDLTMGSASVERYAKGYLLSRSMLHWFRDNYLHRESDQRTASPWFWPDSELRGAAPAIVTTAGFDPLVDEGDSWADRLRAAGVAVRHHRESSLVHGYLSLGGGVRAAKDAVDRICADLVEMMRS
jgi:acetyl esterase